ncbi:uncharacterized protein FOMMEDRAFT_32433 [Fomitiporia mediterranea MF3/22]|uniref:Uncharacterized protein n=1 Tax=Fomitiporia mediterranea (strain MF3/22) TaxID=694068 RepID=R7SG23_FOMME|nr:uncharacterized protein FOMMEDRAFT_32433 [Fomitiporia mediterranea MF3/22]EJC97666.1 hypothetical protein FOMMEDRAFT_32433 [Fomitiporia mediterranea MF3/22]
MKTFSAQLILLASCLGTFALSVRSVPQAVVNDCPSAQEVSSSVISVNGEKILRQVFECPEGNFTSASFDPSKARVLNSRSLFEERSQAECTTPNPECQCGSSVNIPVECGCFEDSSGPSSSDCNSLLGSTPVIASIQGPTFIVGPNQVHSLTLRTCTLGFINLASTNSEYCWDDLVSSSDFLSSLNESILKMIRSSLSQANSMNSVFSCMTDSPIASAVCVALDQRFVSRLGLNQ